MDPFVSGAPRGFHEYAAMIATTNATIVKAALRKCRFQDHPLAFIREIFMRGKNKLPNQRIQYGNQ
jgi:hypothetical protein